MLPSRANSRALVFVVQGATYNASVDVYAFGVLLWELFSEQMPFDGYDIPTVKEKVLSGAF